MTNKILILDIETSPMIVPSFSLYNIDSISPDNILTDWFILSVAWKFLGDKSVRAVNLTDDPARFKKDHTDDMHVVRELHKVLETADIICGHNIVNFDWPKLNTRFIKHGLAPLPKKKFIDTLRIAKKEFKFSSNRLGYITNFLGLGKKLDTPSGLWLKCLAGDAKAFGIMTRYNKQDVVLTEKLFLALRPYSTGNLGISSTTADCSCPRCGSEKLEKRGFSFTLNGKYQRFWCKNCRGWSRSKDNLLSVKHSGLTLAEQMLDPA